jgi:hypothetical protein
MLPFFSFNEKTKPRAHEQQIGKLRIIKASTKLENDGVSCGKPTHYILSVVRAKK